jgi:hypothetical protein
MRLNRGDERLGSRNRLTNSQSPLSSWQKAPPAQNAGGAPLGTTARIAASRSAPRSAALSARIPSVPSALRRSGRFKVSTATGPWRLVSITYLVLSWV